ncbi:uncharacterized protein [Arachis hypogaea]|uniref:uncharacterized protein n=1 Tax=Arachis hypogaea TaxID=3818 RepID=UPI003B20F784
MLMMEKTRKTSKQGYDTTSITFTNSDLTSSNPNLDDPVVISVQAGDLLRMKLCNKAMTPSSGELVGFLGERVSILGSIWIKTTLGEHPYSRTLDIQYLVVNYTSPYNIILDKPSLNSFGAIVSTVHLCVKFQTEDETVATIHADHKEARQGYNASLKQRPNQQAHSEQVQAIHATDEQPLLSELDLRADLHERPLPTGNLRKILMHPADQDKTIFITEFGNFCYKVMPFGLKNAGATYQRLMDKVFHKQIGQNKEVYVNDMVAKTPKGNSHQLDLAEIFAQIRKYNMRLNPEKCAFGVQG